MITESSCFFEHGHYYTIKMYQKNINIIGVLTVFVFPHGTFQQFGFGVFDVSIFYTVPLKLTLFYFMFILVLKIDLTNRDLTTTKGCLEDDVSFWGRAHFQGLLAVSFTRSVCHVPGQNGNSSYFVAPWLQLSRCSCISQPCCQASTNPFHLEVL